jgi:hypothetical protein
MLVVVWSPGQVGGGGTSPPLTHLYMHTQVQCRLPTCMGSVEGDDQLEREPGVLGDGSQHLNLSSGLGVSGASQGLTLFLEKLLVSLEAVTTVNC